MTTLLLLFVALLLIWLEFYLPGGVMGIAGAVIFITSIVLFALESPSPLYTILFTLFAFAALGTLVKWTLNRIQKSSSKQTLYSDADQEGYTASSYDSSLIGKEGVASTDLKPTGHARFEGKSHHVIAQSGYIEKGTRVIVLKGQGSSLIVKELSQEKK